MLCSQIIIRMSLYTVYTVILSIPAYTETSKGQEDPAEMEILLGS